MVNVPVSAYDSDAICLLSTAVEQTMSTADQHRSASEVAEFNRAVTRKLIEAFDGGERDPDALRRVGVEALTAAARWKEARLVSMRRD